MQKILLVQDILTNILLASKIEEVGFEVIQTSSFKEAQENLESGTNDECFAVIIDLNLDDTKDDKAVNYMLERDIKTIIYTQPAEHSLVEDRINKNVVDYIVKETSEDVTYIIKVLSHLQQFEDMQVLIVDDSKTTRTMLADFIAPLGFKTIYQAENGIEALECIKNYNEIHLIITDFNMPKMDGLELTQNLRKRYRDDQVSIISISSEVSSEQSAVLLKYGVSSFLTKPYSKAHLVGIIHNEIDNLLAKQKTKKQKKDLGAFVRKIKTDNMASNRKYEQDIIDITVAKTLLEKELNHLKMKYELMIDKYEKIVERLSTKQGKFVANEIDNSK